MHQIVFKRAKRAHCLVMTFEIFGITYYVKCALFRIQSTAAIFGLKLNGKQAQRAGGIKLFYIKVLRSLSFEMVP